MKIIFLTQWLPDTNPTTIAEAMRVADESFALGPLNSFEHGQSLNLARGSAHQADWGFILDLEPENLEEWRDSEAHQALGRVLRPICGERITIEF